MIYRKKPVEIAAYQFTNPLSGRMPEWLLDAMRTKTVTFHSGDPSHLEIHTLEGTMRGDLNDWIIRGVKGELYPCKPDIFEATYEKVEMLEPGQIAYGEYETNWTWASLTDRARSMWANIENAVRADERERCVEACLSRVHGLGNAQGHLSSEAIRCGDAIRARAPLPGQAILDEVFPSPANKGVRMGVDNDNA